MTVITLMTINYYDDDNDGEGEDDDIIHGPIPPDHLFKPQVYCDDQYLKLMMATTTTSKTIMTLVTIITLMTMMTMRVKMMTLFTAPSHQIIYSSPRQPRIGNVAQ